MGRPQLLMAAVALATALAGCSGTPFGDQLARSFSAPPRQAPSPGPSTVAAGSAPTGTAAAATGAGSGAGASPAKPAALPAAPPALTPAVAPGPTVRAPRPAAAAPAPYRLTLRLPGADPAAPAEAVTQALRAAGVAFEVELIERVRPGEVSPSPLSGAGEAAPRPR